MRRILTIDRGGLRGVIPAAFLAEIEEHIGDRVAGPAVFPQRRRRRLTLRGLTSPLYDLDTLRRAVETVWGSRRLSDSRCRLIIPAYDLKRGEAHVWRTAHGRESEKTGGASDTEAVEVALSASAAPVYFQPYRSPQGFTMLDGGVWAQCPAFLAVTEALGVLKWEPEEIFVLSLGCALPRLQAGASQSFDGGLLRWGPRLLQLFLGVQEAAALEMARLVLGADHIVRINRADPTGSQAIDNPADIERFVQMGRSAARAEFPGLRERFFGRRAEPFIARPR